MNFPFYIARRYLFSKKKHNAINIISGISVCGVALATLALVCTLSVFNGFQDMVASFFTAFDPQLKITVREGKVFDGQDKRIGVVCLLPEVDVFTETLEENAMVQYKDRQAMVVLKGVEDNFEELTAIDSILYGAGDFLLHDSIVNYGVMGGELVATLGTGLQFVDPLQVYLPKRNAKVNMANPGASFNRDYLYSPGVVFVVNQQEYDGKYILTSLDFLRQLLDYTTEVSAIELKLKPGANVSSTFTALPSSFFNPSAVLLPITRLYTFLTLLIIQSSNLLPPIFIDLLITIPPSDKTDISVVSAPMFTIITPLDLVTSSPAPIASATGLSTIYIFLAFTFESATSS